MTLASAASHTPTASASNMHVPNGKHDTGVRLKAWRALLLHLVDVQLPTSLLSACCAAALAVSTNAVVHADFAAGSWHLCRSIEACSAQNVGCQLTFDTMVGLRPRRAAAVRALAQFPPP